MGWGGEGTHIGDRYSRSAGSSVARRKKVSAYDRTDVLGEPVGEDSACGLKAGDVQSSSRHCGVCLCGLSARSAVLVCQCAERKALGMVVGVISAT